MTSDQNSRSELMELYLCKRADLVRFFSARTGSTATAEDLVQELYLKVRLADGEKIVNGTAYLYRLGMNLMVDRYRSEVRGRARDAQYVEATIGMVGGEFVSEMPPAENALDARRRLANLLVTIETLPPQCRRVFQMHKLEGMTHGEVAKALGISRSAVEKHMINALRKLLAAES